MEYQLATPEDGVVHIALNGVINEDAEIVLSEIASTIREKPGAKVTFNFSGVKMINSLGVRAWVQFLRGAEENVEVFFEECTPDVIMQINMIPSFQGKAKIVSFYTNYVCEECDASESILLKTDNLPKGEMPEPRTCSECDAEMETEELEEEYFAFLLK